MLGEEVETTDAPDAESNWITTYTYNYAYNYAYKYTTTVVTLLGLYMLDVIVFRPLRHRMFACATSGSRKAYNEVTLPIKKDLFSTLTDALPREEERRIILEIGIASGCNLQFYPDGCCIIGIDPNTHFTKYLMENMKEYPELNLGRVHSVSAEDMPMVQDNSIPVVVSTCVLCTVDDLDGAIREIKRVLVQGGKFYYLEHVADRRGTLLHVAQNLLTVTNVWPMAFHGCRLNRNIDDSVDKAGFSSVEQERLYIDTSKKYIFKFIQSHLKGVATK